MAFLVEQDNVAVRSESCHTVGEAHTGELENETEKMLARARLERAADFNRNGAVEEPPPNQNFG